MRNGTFMFDFSENLLKHIGHAKGFSPECVRAWLLRGSGNCLQGITFPLRSIMLEENTLWALTGSDLMALRVLNVLEHSKQLNKFCKATLFGSAPLAPLPSS
jgi:hypothetical protein